MKKKVFIVLFLLILGGSQVFAAPCGDVDSSGDINIIDALMTAQYCVGLNPPGFDPGAGEVSGDGVINIIDALQIAQFYVGLISSLAGCAPAPTPSTTEPVMYQLEAETEATWSEGIIDSKHAGFTGSGFVDTVNASGAWIEWRLSVESNTDAVCDFRYACASDARSMDLIVNGTTIVNLNFAASGAWTSWSTEEAPAISLNAGPNTIRLTATTSGGAPNMDRMDITMGSIRVTPVPTPTPAPTPTYIPGTGNYLPQEGNPVHARFNLYMDFADVADNILSYQLDCGGWPNNLSYDSPGSGGSGLGTFDNGTTTMELTAIADAYNRTGDSRYLNSARKALDYVIEAQYPEGGWPQYFPLRGGYSDHVTFNDDAMSRIVTVLKYVVDKAVPFHTDVFTDSQRSQSQEALGKGVDYILKAQIMQNGVKTVWCAQHGKSDYKPKGGRAYEHPSLSGSESIEVIGFLMTQPQTTEIKNAVIAAVDWYRSPNTYLADYAYENDNFIQRAGSRIWYRFYDIATNDVIFSNYNGAVWIGLQYESKKKSGYRWAGTWGEKIIDYANSVGY